MQGHAFTLDGAALVALPSGALFWPDRGLLTVSDLHFGKSSRMARRGGVLMPPWETAETLSRLSADLEATGARHLIALGDSFDDLLAEAEMDPIDRTALLRLMAGRDWVWITGNHDPGPVDLPGTHLAEAHIGPLTFRHIAEAGATAEISGHYHPKARLAGRWHRCFLRDASRVILPAYGAYTGGLPCNDASLMPLFGPQALALLTGKQTLAIPMAAGGR